MSSILFGSISTVADTSELQRDAFNRAFAEAGLDWQWGREEYVEMLQNSGGKNRIAAYAESRGEDVDAEAVHASKSALFQQALSRGRVQARPGVVETITAAKRQGLKLALVTTTSEENVAALLGALSDQIEAGDFDLVVDSGDVSTPKPDPAAYSYAMAQLGVEPGDCVAIEDNVGGVEAAVAAGLTCVAFPNVNTAAHDFARADVRVDELDAAELIRLSEGR